MQKRVAILGSTGSIGVQTLDIIGWYPEYYEVVALSTNQSIELLAEQVRKFHPSRVAITNEERAEEFKKSNFVNDITVESGKESLISLATMEDVDVVVVAVVGIAGLEATIAALKAGKDVALANKEALVAGGHLVMEAARSTGSKLLPVDSEHSAIFQCLQVSSNHSEVSRIFLTASGGPFRGYSRDDLRRVTVDEALKHPNWNMGRKITVDSATLMNKGLEVIEARWLFGLSLEQIQVLIHPQSIVHSMVEFIDGSIIAQMGKTDMRIPILYALSYPKRLPTRIGNLNLIEAGPLTFEKPDFDTFPCLSLAYKAIKIGGTMPAVLNAANEVAVEKFLNKEISFIEIPVMIEKAMRSHKVIKNPDINDILRVDQETRELLQ